MRMRAPLSVLCILLATASAQGQTVWYVDDDNCPGPGKGTEADPFCKIQHGIDAAVDGDEVVVADGTYTGFGNRNLSFLGKAITLRSTHGAAATTIDCEGVDRGFHFHNSETPDSVLDGFRIINGYSEGHGEAAGIFFDYSSPTVRNCDIRHNSLNGIQWHHSNATVSNCIIAENEWGLHGQYSNPNIENCVVQGNSGVIGGMYFHSFSHVTVTNSLIVGNESSTNACPGIQLGWLTTFAITNCTIAGNTSGSGDASAGGVVYDASGNISNSVIWGNWGLEVAAWTSGSPGTAVVTYSDIEDGYDGVGNINDDPLFVGSGTFDLLPGSPCIDAADNTAVPPGVETDLDGNPRFVDDPTTPDTGNPDGINPIVDMGAYEFQLVDLCLDTDGDGQVIICHIPPGNPGNAHTITVSVNAVPAHLAHGDTCGPCEDDNNLLLMAGEHEACFADMDGDGVVSAADLALLLGTWGQSPGHSADFDGDGVVDAADLAVLLGSWGSCE